MRIRRMRTEQRISCPQRAWLRQSASVRDLGRALVSAEAGGFLLPFEALSLLLVAALVGAVTVARPIEKERQTKDLT